MYHFMWARKKKNEAEPEIKLKKTEPKKEPHKILIQVMGDPGVGKSSAILKMENPQNPIPANFIVQVNNDGFVIRKRDDSNTFFIYDGQMFSDGFRTVMPPRARGVGVIVFLLVDITNRESYNHLPSWMQEIDRYYMESDIILVGTKHDVCHQRQVSVEELTDYAELRNIHYLETSAIIGKNIEQLLQLAYLHAVRKRYDDTGESPPTDEQFKQIVSEANADILLDERISQCDTWYITGLADGYISKLREYTISANPRSVERGFFELLEGIKNKFPAREAAAAANGEAARMEFHLGAMKAYLESLKRYKADIEAMDDSKLKKIMQHIVNDFFDKLTKTSPVRPAPPPMMPQPWRYDYSLPPQPSMPPQPSVQSQPVMRGEPEIHQFTSMAHIAARLQASDQASPRSSLSESELQALLSIPDVAVPPSPRDEPARYVRRESNPAPVVEVKKAEPSADAKELLELLEDVFLQDPFEIPTRIIPNGTTFNLSSLQAGNIAIDKQQNLKLQQILNNETPWTKIYPNHLVDALITLLGKPDFTLTKIPDCMVCLLSKKVFVDPVVASNGVTYERANLETYQESNGDRLPDGSAATGRSYRNKVVIDVIAAINKKLDKEEKKEFKQ